MVKLTAREIGSLSQPGRYTDGDGLVLFIDSSGRKYWQFRFTLDGKRKDLSFGPERHLSLCDAREAAPAYKAQVTRRNGLPLLSVDDASVNDPSKTTVLSLRFARGQKARYG